MGEFLSHRRWRHILWRSLLGVAISAAFVLSYQNCSGMAGNQLTGSVSSQVNPALANQALPLQMTMNQISVMTCGNAGTTGATATDPIENPYYHVRFGAFNNTSYSATSTANSSAYSQGVFQAFNGTNVGGISFSASAISFLQQNTPNPPPTQLQSFLESSPYTNNSQPMAAIISPSRIGGSQGSLAPTFSTSGSGQPVAVPLLQTLTNSTLQTELINAPIISSGGTQPAGFFYNIGGPSGSLLGSLYFPITVMATLRNALAQNYLFFGFTNATNGPAGIIQGMQSPDGDPSKRLFGTAYTLSSFTAPNPLGAPGYFYLEGGVNHTTAAQNTGNPFYPGSVYCPAGCPSSNQIQEFNLDPATSTSAPVQTSASESWDCTHLQIVRDVDRKYYTLPATFNGVNTSVAINRQNGQVGCTVSSYNGTANPVTPATPGACALFSSYPNPNGSGLPVVGTIAAVTPGTAYNQVMLAGTANFATAATSYRMPAGATGTPGLVYGYYASTTGITQVSDPLSGSPTTPLLVEPNGLFADGGLAYNGVYVPVYPQNSTSFKQMPLVIHPQLVPTLQSLGLQTNYYGSQAEVAAIQSVVQQIYCPNAVAQTPYTSSSYDSNCYLNYPVGTARACPPEDPSTLSPAQLDQLHIWRRFLAADMWDINISMGCAVPTSNALSSGMSCYVSGDGDPTGGSASTMQFIQYDPSQGCDNGTGLECAATVSVCTRFK